jgi:hypothetical protein
MIEDKDYISLGFNKRTLIYYASSPNGNNYIDEENLKDVYAKLVESRMGGNTYSVIKPNKYHEGILEIYKVYFYEDASAELDLLFKGKINTIEELEILLKQVIRIN